MSPVHLRMADVQISSSLSPCPPLAELNEMVWQYLLSLVN